MKNTYNIDLSSKEGSMSNIIQNNHSILDNCTTTSELVSKLKQLFVDNNLDTQATRRLIMNVSKHKNFSSALLTIYNSYLCGSKMSVI